MDVRVLRLPNDCILEWKRESTVHRQMILPEQEPIVQKGAEKAGQTWLGVQIRMHVYVDWLLVCTDFHSLLDMLYLLYSNEHHELATTHRCGAICSSRLSHHSALAEGVGLLRRWSGGRPSDTSDHHWDTRKRPGIASSPAWREVWPQTSANPRWSSGCGLQ